MSKFLRFSVTEKTGRTFDLPKSEAIKILRSYGVDCTNWNEQEIAEELYNCYSDDIAMYEKENQYFESNVDEAEIYC